MSFSPAVLDACHVSCPSRCVKMQSTIGCLLLYRASLAACTPSLTPTVQALMPQCESLLHCWHSCAPRCCAGLHPAVPYFSQLITEEVKANLRDLPRLHLLLKVVCMHEPRQRGTPCKHTL